MQLRENMTCQHIPLSAAMSWALATCIAAWRLVAAWRALLLSRAAALEADLDTASPASEASLAMPARALSEANCKVLLCCAAKALACTHIAVCLILAAC